MRLGKTMSWCCLTSGNERSAIEISRLRPSDDGAKRYQDSAALLIFMRRTAIPHSSFLIPNSRKAFIHNQWVEPPHGLTLNPEPLFHIRLFAHAL